MIQDKALTKAWTSCPRCGTRLTRTYGYEPSCLVCGFADYSSVPEKQVKEEKSLLTSGRLHIARYRGEHKYLRGVVVTYRVGKRESGRMINIPTCPFTYYDGRCGVDMFQRSLSGKRANMFEERFLCPNGHRLSLLITSDGIDGWK